MKTPSLKVSGFKTGLFQIALLFVVLLALWWKAHSLDLAFTSWFAQWFESAGAAELPFVLLLLALMPLNWALEAKRWQVLSAPVKPLPFVQSYRAVLSGLSLSFIAPSAIADYLGRIWQVQQGRRYRLWGAILINRLTQMSVTLAFGLWGIWAFAQRQSAGIQASVYVLLTATVLLLLTCLLIINYRKGLAPRLMRKRMRRLAAALRILNSYGQSIIVKVWGLAILRYAVFTMQFLLALWLCGVEAPVQILLAGIAWIFLIKSVVPGIQALQSLGVRELSALIFFEGISPQLTAIVWAGLLLWGINILVPATGGAFALLRAKI